MSGGLTPAQKRLLLALAEWDSPTGWARRGSTDKARPLTGAEHRTAMVLFNLDMVMLGSGGVAWLTEGGRSHARILALVDMDNARAQAEPKGGES